MIDFLHSLGSTDGLQSLITNGGPVLLALIIFAENGLLVGFFLPGDSLLITAGILIGSQKLHLDFLPLAALLAGCAIIGETTGYYIGKKIGATLYQRPNSRFFKRAHLIRTHAFYEKHGGKTIVLARFIPILRTFVPVVAGAAWMDAKKFFTYNVIGGILWIFGVMGLGLALGQSVKNIGDYLYLVIGIIIFLSILPPIIEIIRSRRRAAAEIGITIEE
jgi:membrane-associated protein